ncbi:MAG: hypothetical protein DWH94_03655 [Planctomycetota bacterium]|nr:MAG: hypothetical protein DWH94_03655 [Planctomycetota bacterium]
MRASVKNEAIGRGQSINRSNLLADALVTPRGTFNYQLLQRHFTVKASLILWHCVLTVFCERRSLLYGEHFEKLCPLFIIERGPGVSKIAFENVPTASCCRLHIRKGRNHDAVC